MIENRKTYEAPIAKFVFSSGHPCRRKGCRFKKRNGRCGLTEIRIQGTTCLEFQPKEKLDDN